VTRKGNFTPKEQQVTIKKAFDDIHECMTAREWSKAFLLAFSFLEDRIGTMYRQEYDFRCGQGLEPAPNPAKFETFAKKVSFLEKVQLLRPEEAEEMRQVAMTRNNIVHDFLWSADAVDHDLCLRTLRAARKADNARGRQKTRHKKAVAQAQPPR
jgi:hypothetical protein